MNRLAVNRTCNVFQKPLMRIDIKEVGGELCSAEMKSVASKASVQEASREEFSPLSTSPAAKMIKIEELPEAPTQTSDQYVVPSFFVLF